MIVKDSPHFLLHRMQTIARIMMLAIQVVCFSLDKKVLSVCHDRRIIPWHFLAGKGSKNPKAIHNVRIDILTGNRAA